jgi:hypothetical protein
MKEEAEFEDAWKVINNFFGGLFRDARLCID